MRHQPEYFRIDTQSKLNKHRAYDVHVHRFPNILSFFFRLMPESYWLLRENKMHSAVIRCTKLAMPPRFRLFLGVCDYCLPAARQCLRMTSSLVAPRPAPKWQTGWTLTRVTNAVRRARETWLWENINVWGGRREGGAPFQRWYCCLQVSNGYCILAPEPLLYIFLILSAHNVVAPNCQTLRFSKF